MRCRRRKSGKKRKWKQKKTMVLEVVGSPVEVRGHLPGSQWSGYYRLRMYLGLMVSCAETGDLLDREPDPGASYLVRNAG